MPASAHKRHRILVDRKFQVGFSLEVIGYVYMYLVLFALLANAEALKTVIFGGASEERYIEAVGRLQIFVQVFVIPLVFTFICMCLHGVLFSHRLAGPIHRFKESLRRVRAGDLESDVQIRDRDYFQDLCEEINGLIGRLRTDLIRFRKASRRLAEEGEVLAREGGLPREAQERIVEFANASTKLRQLVDGYRLGVDESTEPEPATGSPVGS